MTRAQAQPLQPLPPMGRALRPRLGTRKYWKKNQEFEMEGLKEKKRKQGLRLSGERRVTEGIS